MRALSLFSGVGGLDLAAQQVGIQTVAFVEKHPFCQRLLATRWPGVPIYDDIHTVSAARLAADGIGHIDLIHGGFPCQSVSVAGRQAAWADPRWLWPEMARLIRDVTPRWVVGENVRNLLALSDGAVMGGLLRDLADLGYDVGWACYGAGDVGAPHRRERVFLVARLADPIRHESK